MSTYHYNIILTLYLCYIILISECINGEDSFIPNGNQRNIYVFTVYKDVQSWLDRIWSMTSCPTASSYCSSDKFVLGPW